MEQKECTQCKKMKEISEYYVCKYKERKVRKSECKKCTIKRNGSYAKANSKKRNRAGNSAYQEYQRNYYANNQEKFKNYRKEFKVRHPNYFKDRYLEKKQRDNFVQESLTERDVA